ncbi:class I SAM-dependent rRNA methyltransferase [Paraburkholderia adhaesiva]|uniref:class I SAM-dependent rRNA methyltransferase n=1 Tax=Paraburkholderia adhaesiva TaxID=2883244 RepID=UPI001F23CA44|nr:class I SAM-dependent rRNA methyltransferase [Paraburkholderia adhaesiva]
MTETHRTQDAGMTDIQHIPTQKLLAELARRQALHQMQGAIEALYDQLERTGALSGDSALSAYLMYRVRREAALVHGTPNAHQSAQFWQAKIDALDEDQRNPARPPPFKTIHEKGNFTRTARGPDHHAGDIVIRPSQGRTAKPHVLDTGSRNIRVPRRTSEGVSHLWCPS